MSIREIYQRFFAAGPPLWRVDLHAEVPVSTLRLAVQPMDVLLFRVAARFQRQADGQPGGRQDAKRLTTPINKPKGIDKSIVKDQGQSVEARPAEEAPGYDRRDIRPEDVFPGTPNHMGVLNLAETGKDLQKALDKQIPKDKGHDSVSNLSQYLIETQGGGGTPPVGPK